MQFRTWGHEHLDRADVPDEDLRASMAEVWAINRYLGGMAVLKRHLRPLLDRGQVTLLDVAGGTGDVTLALAQWAARHGAQVRVALLDNHPGQLRVAQERLGALPGAVIVQGDACHLPFPNGQFDLAICNLALHHFSSMHAPRVLAEMARVTKRGWVVSDLARHPLAWLSARALAATVWRHPYTQHDGPMSVRRSFTYPEAVQLVHEAGVKARVHRHFPFRLAWVGESS